MGNHSSSASPSFLLDTPLVPQSRFPRVVNPRFVLDRVTSLRLPLGFWSHDHSQPLDLADIDTDTVIFKINPPVSGGESTRKQLLLDKNGVPVAVMDCYPVTLDCAMYVPYVPLPASVTTANSDAAAWVENHAMCFLQTNMRALEQRLLVELEDPLTRSKIKIRVEGNWRDHEALFWLDRGIKLKRECIARVYAEVEVRQRIKELRRNKESAADGEISYRVDVAPGVDVAFVVLVCAALDDELAKKESGQKVEIGSDELTKLLAERHHGVKARNLSTAKVCMDIVQPPLAIF